MPTTTLRLGDVTLHLVLEAHDVEVAGSPYLDWFRSRLQLTDGEFSGSVRWNVMPAELGRLAAELDRIFDAYPSRECAEFVPAEPNLKLNLSVGSRGNVEGTYELCADIASGGPTLRGVFTLEQSVLPGLAADIRDFIAAAASHAV